jgi:hypothetical protein
MPVLMFRGGPVNNLGEATSSSTLSRTNLAYHQGVVGVKRQCLTIRALAREKDISEVYNLHFNAHTRVMRYISSIEI